MKSTLKTISVVASSSIAAFAIVGSASAAQINANLGFIPSGSGPAYVGANLSTATSITFSDANAVNQIPLQYQPPGGVLANNDFNGSNAGALAPVTLFSSVSLVPQTLAIGPGLPIVVNFIANGSPATFTASSFFKNSADANSLNLNFLGTITGTGFDPSAGSLSFAFTQVGGTGAVNYSATLSSPPAFTGVPEPGTILGLMAFGAAGLVSRRRKS